MEKESIPERIQVILEDHGKGNYEKLLHDLKRFENDDLLIFSLGQYGFGTQASRSEAVRDVINNIILERLNEELIRVEKSISTAGKRMKWAAIAIGFTGLVVSVVSLLHGFKVF